MKKFIVFVTVVIAILGCLGFWFIVKERQAARQEEKKPVSPKSQNLQDIEIRSIIEYEDYYNLAVHYPITKNEAVNQAVLSMVNNYLADFRAQAQAFNQGSRLPFWKYEFNINYEVHRPCQEIVSFKFDIFTSKMEEKSTVIETRTFQLGSGQELKLKNLFKENTDYLNQLAKMVNRELDSQAINEQDLNHFALGKKSLVFFLPLGKTEIKYAWLEDIFKNDLFQQPFGLAEPFLTLPPKKPVHVETGYSLVAALTFDDGPDSETTVKILDLLKQKGIVATFFVIGNRAQYYPEIITRMANEGHEIGNHTWSHRQLNNISQAEAKAEVDKTQQAIKSLTGVGPNILRSPYGEIDETVVANSTLPLIHYSVYTQDWRYQNQNAIINHIVVSAQNNDIIMMHELYPWNVNSLETILNQLISRGFKFVTVSQLLGFDKDPDKAIPGHVFRPRH